MEDRGKKWTVKNSAGGLLFAFLLSTAYLAVTPAPGHGQGPGEEVLYKIDFDDGQAQGWELEQPAWQVDARQLNGKGHAWARYTKGSWEEARVGFRLKTNGVHVNVRTSETGRYAIGFKVLEQDNLLLLYLFKQLWPDKFYNNLANKATKYAADNEHRVEIVTKGGRIRVTVNGTLMIDYADPDPLPPGTIAFETLEGTYAQVDDVVVIGPRIAVASPTVEPPATGEPPVAVEPFEAVEPPMAVAPEHRPDLVVGKVGQKILEGGRRLVITVEVKNNGNTPAPAAMVRAAAPGLRSVTTTHRLVPGNIEEVNIELEIRDELRQQSHRFEVFVDPENKIAEGREDNNWQAIEVWVPSDVGKPPPANFPPPWVWVGAGVLLLGLGAAIGRALNMRTRLTWERTAQLQWQMEASTELPEPKEVCNWACKAQFTNELLKRWRVTALELTPLPVSSGKTPPVERVEGEILDRLTEAAQPQYIMG